MLFFTDCVGGRRRNHRGRIRPDLAYSDSTSAPKPGPGATASAVHFLQPQPAKLAGGCGLWAKAAAKRGWHA